MKRTLLFEKNSRYLRAVLALVLTVFTISTSFAQNRRITGKVSDNDGPVIGATIRVKGTTDGVITDVSGNFAINVPNNAVLTVSLIGYVSQDVAVNGQSNINVTMQTESQQMQEVVVIGYGTAKRGDLTQAIGSVGAKQIQQVPVTNLDQALQGRVAGVQVTNNGGNPGAGTSIVIRGVGSLSGTNPLYIVDGYPTTGIGNISPNDVESMDILKDAAAKAIYGNRASNGVVVITTKRGTKGAPVISLNVIGSMETKPTKYNVLNAQEWATLANSLGAIENFDRLPEWSNPAALRNLDWQDAIRQTGYRQDYNLGIRGGTDKLQSAVSLSFNDNRGTFYKVRNSRITLSANLDYTPKTWLKSATSINITRNPGYTGGLDNQRNTTRAIPTMTGNKFTDQIDDGNGNYGFYTPTNSQVRNAPVNPFYASNTNENRNAQTTIRAVQSLQATLWGGIKLKTQVGLNSYNSYSYNFTPADTRSQDQYGTNQVAGLNSFNQNTRVDYDVLWENTLAYDKTFGLHTVNFVGGISQQIYNRYETGVGARDLSNAQLRIISAATRENWDTPSNTINNSALTSQFARIGYNYASKYYLTASVRRDGSANFAPGKQYGVFPAASLMWRIKEESFLKNSTVFSDLRLRGSYGETGNAGNSQFQYLELYDQGPAPTSGGNYGYTFNKVYQPGYFLSALPNPNLKWETTKETNIAVEAAFLKGDLSFIVEYFRKESKDFLLSVPIPAQTGFSNAQRNVGSIQNSGLEFTVNYRHAVGDFNYNLNFNISTIQNKLLSLGTSLQSVDNLVSANQLGLTGGTGNNNWSVFTRSYVNGNIGTFYGYRANGIFQTQAEIDQLNAAAAAKYGVGIQYSTAAKPGDRRFVDLNGDGRINADDRENIGSPIPKFFGGLTADLSYKQFDMNIFFNYSYGNKILNYMQSTLESFQQTTGSTGLQNINRDYYLNAWSPTNPSNRYARITSNDPHGNTRPSSLYVEDGSYVRLKNLQIGYTLPTVLAKKIDAGKIRLFVTGTNLFTITKYSGLNPEIGGNGPTGSGADNGSVPISQLYSVGAQITF